MGGNALAVWSGDSAMKRPAHLKGCGRLPGFASLPFEPLLKAVLRLARRQLLILSVGLVGFSSLASAEPKLVIATGEEPPTVSENPKESFFTEVMSEVAREMGVTFEFKFMPWKRCEYSLEQNEAWGAVPYVSTPERQEKFYFSDKLFNKKAKFFYYSPDGKEKNIPFTKLDDLKTYRIGAVIGYYYVKGFVDAGLNLEPLPTAEQNWQKLKAGRIDLFPSQELTGRYLLKKLFPEESENFIALEKPFDESGNYLITSKNYPDTQNLLIRFNAALKTVKANGTYQRILDKFGLVQSY
jgi:polar amino acid transport system substrate-binding protein